MTDRAHHLLRRRSKPTNWRGWVPLPQYATDHFLSDSTARRLILRRQLPAVKLGGRWYVKDS